MKKYILYTLLLVFAANVGYAQDREAIEAAKKRLLELRAKKAQIEQEMQEILQPDKIVTTEIKDGVRTQTIETKEQKIPRTNLSEVISGEEIVTENKISRREQRRQKRTENSYAIINNKKEKPEETSSIEVSEELEVEEPKLSRRDRRRQRQIENTDIAIEEPEEIEVTIEPEAEEIPAAIEIVEEVSEEMEVEEPKLSRRDRRRQRQIENTDIAIEEPEEIEVTIEPEAAEVPAAIEIVETSEIEELEVEEPKLSRRDRRRQRQIENTDIAIEEPEEPSVEMVVGENIDIFMEKPEAPTVETMEKPAEIEPEKPRPTAPKLEPEIEEMVMETPSAPKVEVNIQSFEIRLEEGPQLEIEAKIPEIKTPPVVGEKVEERPIKLTRRERRKLRQTENFDIVTETPEEAPVIEIAAPESPIVEENEVITIIKDPEEEAIIAEIENAAEQKTRLSIDVVDMPSAEPLGLRLSDEAALAMTDILTAKPPESVPPEITFYDAKLKLIVGEMEALASKSALLPSGMKRINEKLTTIESQLLKFDDMRSETQTAKYMNFMQMNIDILQNITGDSNANAPDAMLMEPEASPSAAPAPQGAQKVYFMRNSDQIGFRFGKELEALATTAKDIPTLYLVIESIDESPQNEPSITQKRAENIREFLQKEGVSELQIRSSHFGNTADELAAQPAIMIQIVDN